MWSRMILEISSALICMSLRPYSLTPLRAVFSRIRSSCRATLPSNTTLPTRATTPPMMRGIDALGQRDLPAERLAERRGNLSARRFVERDGGESSARTTRSASIAFSLNAAAMRVEMHQPIAVREESQQPAQLADSAPAAPDELIHDGALLLPPEPRGSLSTRRRVPRARRIRAANSAISRPYASVWPPFWATSNRASAYWRATARDVMADVAWETAERRASRARYTTPSKT